MYIFCIAITSKKGGSPFSFHPNTTKKAKFRRKWSFCGREELSKSVSDLYMEDFEEQALSSAPNAPKIYIDDAFTIWKRNDVEDFLHTASHHSTTNHPFYNRDWEWQHNSLSWHIGHKRFRRTPHTTSVYQKPTHWSIPVLWHTTLNQFKKHQETTLRSE